MLRLLRALGNTLLWVLAVLGVASGALFVGSRTGVVQPVVVISGSMTPDIQPGDLLIATPTPIEQLQPGTVATIRSAETKNFVTHRVVSVVTEGDTYAVTMKGDANDIIDDETYLIAAGTEVWLPKVTVPAGGRIAANLTNQRVAIPALIAILAMLAMSLFPPPQARHQDPDGALKLRRRRNVAARHRSTRGKRELAGASK